jgi:hypothetical protein
LRESRGTFRARGAARAADPSFYKNLCGNPAGVFPGDPTGCSRYSNIQFRDNIPRRGTGFICENAPGPATSVFRIVAESRLCPSFLDRSPFIV